MKNQGKFAEAEILLKEAFQKRLRRLGSSHSDTFGNHIFCMPYPESETQIVIVWSILCIASMISLGNLYQEEGKLGEAEKYFLLAYNGRKESLGIAHMDTLQSVNSMAVLLQLKGKLEEADAIFNSTLAHCRSELGDEHVLTIECITNIASFRWKQGTYATCTHIQTSNSNSVVQENLKRPNICLRKRLRGSRNAWARLVLPPSAHSGTSLCC